jgi:hypothetical protein
MAFIIVILIIGIISALEFFCLFRQTDLLCYLFLNFGGMIGSLGALPVFQFGMRSEELWSDLLLQVMVIPGAVLAFIGIILFATIERENVLESYRNRPFLDFLLINVPLLEREQYVPSLSWRLGTSLSVIGVLGGTAICVSRYPSESYFGIIVTTLGWVIFVFSCSLK